MEYKTLVLGMIFAMGIFAVKSGVGLHYLVTQKEDKKIKLISFSLYSLVYLMLFLTSSWILQKVDIILYFRTVQKFLQSGMLVHILMAGVFIIWGIVLMIGREGPEKGSKGWMALIIPCPVCMTVIFLTAAFLLSYFPDSGYVSIIWGYMGFICIVFLTMIGMTLWDRGSGSSPESNMGTAMFLIAVYFILSVIIMPQFGDIDKIYRLAAYEGEKQVVDLKKILSFYSILVAFFTIGFIPMWNKMRGNGRWT